MLLNALKTFYHLKISLPQHRIKLFNIAACLLGLKIFIKQKNKQPAKVLSQQMSHRWPLLRLQIQPAKSLNYLLYCHHYVRLSTFYIKYQCFQVANLYFTKITPLPAFISLALSLNSHQCWLLKLFIAQSNNFSRFFFYLFPKKTILTMILS